MDLEVSITAHCLTSTDVTLEIKHFNEKDRLLCAFLRQLLCPSSDISAIGIVGIQNVLGSDGKKKRIMHLSVSQKGSLTQKGSLASDQEGSFGNDRSIDVIDCDREIIRLGVDVSHSKTDGISSSRRSSSSSSINIIDAPTCERNLSTRHLWVTMEVSHASTPAYKNNFKSDVIIPNGAPDIKANDVMIRNRKSERNQQYLPEKDSNISVGIPYLSSNLIGDDVVSVAYYFDIRTAEGKYSCNVLRVLV